MLKSPYKRGLALFAVYVFFELAFALLLVGKAPQDALIARFVVVGGTVFGLLIFSQLARYAGALLILGANAYTAFTIGTDFATKGVSSGKGGFLLAGIIVGQVVFGIVASLYLLSPGFGRDFVALRDNPDRRLFSINIHPRVYQVATALVFLAAIVAISGDIKRVVHRISATETAR